MAGNESGQDMANNGESESVSAYTASKDDHLKIAKRIWQ